jgi:hypothetical protein
MKTLELYLNKNQECRYHNLFLLRSRSLVGYYITTAADATLVGGESKPLSHTNYRLKEN